jgi:hypothetical protein
LASVSNGLLSWPALGTEASVAVDAWGAGVKVCPVDGGPGVGAAAEVAA